MLDKMEEETDSIVAKGTPILMGTGGLVFLFQPKKRGSEFDTREGVWRGTSEGVDQLENILILLKYCIPTIFILFVLK